MTVVEHNRILAIGFGVFAAIFTFTILLLMVVSLGVFAALGITFADETRDSRQAGIGIIGGVVAVIFYALLGAIFVLPMALASWRMLKGKRNARIWGDYRRDFSRHDLSVGNDVRHLRFVVFLQRGRPTIPFE